MSLILTFLGVVLLAPFAAMAIWLFAAIVNEMIQDRSYRHVCYGILGMSVATVLGVMALVYTTKGHL